MYFRVFFHIFRVFFVYFFHIFHIFSYFFISFVYFSCISYMFFHIFHVCFYMKIQRPCNNWKKNQFPTGTSNCRNIVCSLYNVFQACSSRKSSPLGTHFHFQEQTQMTGWFLRVTKYERKSPAPLVGVNENLLNLTDEDEWKQSLNAIISKSKHCRLFDLL